MVFKKWIVELRHVESVVVENHWMNDGDLGYGLKKMDPRFSICGECGGWQLLKGIRKLRVWNSEQVTDADMWRVRWQRNLKRKLQAWGIEFRSDMIPTYGESLVAEHHQKKDEDFWIVMKKTWWTKISIRPPRCGVGLGLPKCLGIGFNGELETLFFFQKRTSEVMKKAWGIKNTSTGAWWERTFKIPRNGMNGSGDLFLFKDP